MSMTEVKVAKAIMGLFSLGGLALVVYGFVSDPVDMTILSGAIVALMAFFWAALTLSGRNI